MIDRREFIVSGLGAAVASGAIEAEGSATTTLDQQTGARPEYYELRLYHLRRGPQQRRIEQYFGEAALPAWRRLGIGPVGFFNVAIGPDSPTLYVLVTHRSIESFATAGERLRADAEYQKAGASFLSLPATDPGYVRMESSLMVSFPGMPRLEVPAGVQAKRPRLFELRTYESHNKRANKKKIEMFDIGETAIFRRTGLQPVFFGETLVGPKQPNLTYMLVFDDMAARDKNWAAFVADPEWKKLSSMPEYADAEIVSNISSVFLRLTSFSQI